MFEIRRAALFPLDGHTANRLIMPYLAPESDLKRLPAAAPTRIPAEWIASKSLAAIS